MFRAFIAVLLILFAAAGSTCEVAPAGSALPAATCNRSYYNTAFRVGFDLPAGLIGPGTSGSIPASGYIYESWSSPSNPSLTVVSLAAHDSSMSLSQEVDFIVDLASTGSQFVTKSEAIVLNSGQDGWLLVRRGRLYYEIVSVEVLLLSNGRLYALTGFCNEADGIYNEALLTGIGRSLCAD